MTSVTRQLERIRNLTRIDGWRWGIAKAESELWERYFCVDTSAASVEAERAVPAESIRYEPLPWFLVRRAVSALRLRPDDVFVDYGAGLGRALLMAARTQLKRVVGVELLGPLVERARRNVLVAKPRLKAPVEVIAADATQWDVPDDVSVAYLFNPFIGSVMKAVQGKLRASLARRPRPLRVLYAHADDQADLFAPCDWLALAQRMDGGIYRNLQLKVYVSTPALQAEMCPPPLT